MASGNADWQFLDVESGPIPEESRSSLLPDGGCGRIVVLAATPAAQLGGWASRAVVSIARAWADEGLRIFLMDLGLEKPALHEALDLPNEDGVSDAFLYGASVQHIARPALEETIFFAPAGTATADPEEVLGHPRWDDLAGGFSEADATLLLFLPTDIPGAESILDRATDVLFLAREGESLDEHLGLASVKVVTMLGPSGSPQEEAEEVGHPEFLAEEGFPGGLDLTLVDSAEDPGEEGLEFGPREGLRLADGFAGGASEDEVPDGVPSSDEPVLDESILQEAGDTAAAVPDFDAEFAEIPSVEDEAVGESPEAEFGQGLMRGSDFGDSRPAGDASSTPAMEREAFPMEGEALGEPPLTGESTRERPRPTLPPRKIFTTGRVLGIVVALSVLVSAGLTAFGALDIPGLTFLQRDFSEVPDPPTVLAGPQPTDPLLSYSLELDRFGEDQLDYAAQMVDAWRSRLPELLFILVPMESEGALSYALLVGPAVDRAQAEALRGPTAGIRPQEDPESWLIRETPRGFHLGRWATLPEARDFLETMVWTFIDEGGEVQTVQGVFGYILRVAYPDGTDRYEVFAGAYEGIPDARPLQEILRQNGLTNVPLIERKGRLPG